MNTIVHEETLTGRPHDTSVQKANTDNENVDAVKRRALDITRCGCKYIYYIYTLTCKTSWMNLMQNGCSLTSCPGRHSVNDDIVCILGVNIDRHLKFDHHSVYDVMSNVRCRSMLTPRIQTGFEHGTVVSANCISRHSDGVLSNFVSCCFLPVTNACSLRWIQKQVIFHMPPSDCIGTV